jgi:diaminopimelate epimerase
MIWYEIFNYFCFAAMTLVFTKYQGTGNDFIMLDNTKGVYDNLSITDIKLLCQRKFGIGSDGLIMLQLHPHLDFEMIYFNADGSQSFCGNGARCAVSYAAKLGLLNGPFTRFLAIDGQHEAWLCGDEIKLKMADAGPIKIHEQAFEVNTGSPHYVVLDANHATDNVLKIGRLIRYSEAYQEEGINVNLLHIDTDLIHVATYERGVEDETLSCGTGVTAAALVYAQIHNQRKGNVRIKTKGGQLLVEWEIKEDNSFSAIYLTGPAKQVFQGNYELER